jgi:hypothetical protein
LISKFVVALAAWWALAASAAAAPTLPAPRMTTPPAGGVAEAPEGHLLAAWEPVDASTDGAGGPVRYQLEIGRDPGFERARIVVAGADSATLLSGLRGGDTWLRVRALRGGAAGSWSEPGTVRVDYPDLGLVRNLFALGAATGVFLLAAIVVGVRRTAARRESSR